MSRDGLCLLVRVSVIAEMWTSVPVENEERTILHCGKCVCGYTAIVWYRSNSPMVIFRPLPARTCPIILGQ